MRFLSLLWAVIYAGAVQAYDPANELKIIDIDPFAVVDESLEDQDYPIVQTHQCENPSNPYNHAYCAVLFYNHGGDSIKQVMYDYKKGYITHTLYFDKNGEFGDRYYQKDIYDKNRLLKFEGFRHDLPDGTDRIDYYNARTNVLEYSEFTAFYDNKYTVTEFYRPDNSIKKIEHRDTDNRIIEMTVYDQGQNLYQRERYTYNTDGRVIKIHHYNTDKTLHKISLYYYSAEDAYLGAGDGRAYKKTVYYRDDKPYKTQIQDGTGGIIK